MASRSIQEKPFLLIAVRSSSNYIYYDIEGTKDPILKQSYLKREVLKAKAPTYFSLESYIMGLSRTDRTQFFLTHQEINKSVYLTGIHFTLGLDSTDANTELVIKNLAHSTQIYVFVCESEKKHFYQGDTKQHKALINKNSIMDDFERHRVDAGKKHTVPGDSVYFLYSSTHSHFSMEIRTTAPHSTNYLNLVIASQNANALPGCKCAVLQDLNRSLLAEVASLSQELAFRTNESTERMSSSSSSSSSSLCEELFKSPGISIKRESTSTSSASKRGSTSRASRSPLPFLFR